MRRVTCCVWCATCHVLRVVCVVISLPSVGLRARGRAVLRSPPRPPPPPAAPTARLRLRLRRPQRPPTERSVAAAAPLSSRPSVCLIESSGDALRLSFLRNFVGVLNTVAASVCRSPTVVSPPCALPHCPRTALPMRCVASLCELTLFLFVWPSAQTDRYRCVYFGIRRNAV